MTRNTPTLNQLKRGLELAERIAKLQAEMASIFGGSADTASAPVAPSGLGRKGRRKLSAKALANIRAAQKKRWAKFKSQKGPAKAKPVAKPAKKRTLTKAGRARLAAAMKARWAAARKSGGPLPTAKK
jgi:hypothetical protein